MDTSFIKVIDRGLQALVYAKFKSILGLTDVNNDSVIYPKDVAFRKISEKRGRAVVEFFNIWRESMEFDWARQRSAVARQDMYLKFSSPSRTDLLAARSIPVTLTYNAWFWTKDYDKLQQLAEDYSWWQHTDPNLNINYNEVYPMEMDLHFGASVDESTTEEMFDKGLYFVLRVPIIVDGWIIKDFSDKTIKKIIISIYDDSAVPSNPQLLEQETLILPEPASGEGI